MKVYVVFQGTYSERDAVAVFSDEEEAKKFALRIEPDPDDTDIQEFEIDGMEEYMKQRPTYVVSMRENGDHAWAYPNIHNKPVHRDQLTRYPRLSNQFSRFETVVFADCKFDAIKAANDRRIQFLAKGE